MRIFLLTFALVTFPVYGMLNPGHDALESEGQNLSPLIHPSFDEYIEELMGLENFIPYRPSDHVDLGTEECSDSPLPTTLGTWNEHDPLQAIRDVIMADDLPDVGVSQLLYAADIDESLPLVQRFNQSQRQQRREFLFVLGAVCSLLVPVTAIVMTILIFSSKMD